MVASQRIETVFVVAGTSRQFDQWKWDRVPLGGTTQFIYLHDVSQMRGYPRPWKVYLVGSYSLHSRLYHSYEYWDLRKHGYLVEEVQEW